jgi:hypothetical protein
MQDEPEAWPCFSHKMSLKERFRMLGIDHQHGNGEKLSLEQIQAFVEACGGVRF